MEIVCAPSIKTFEKPFDALATFSEHTKQEIFKSVFPVLEEYLKDEHLDLGAKMPLFSFLLQVSFSPFYFSLNIQNISCLEKASFITVLNFPLPLPGFFF